MKVLLVDNESPLCDTLITSLHQIGCTVDVTPCGCHAVQCAKEATYDAVVIELMLDGISGALVCDKVREAHPSIPVIMMGTDVGIDIRVELLKVCDDYMDRPVAPDELHARIQASRRRGPVQCSNSITAHDIRLDSMTHEVWYKDKLLHLRKKMFDLLEFFMKNYGVALSRTEILHNVWDNNVNQFTNTVDVHVRLLREKLHGEGCKYIHTIPKKGYKFYVDAK